MAADSSQAGERELRQKLAQFLSEAGTNRSGLPEVEPRLEVLAVLRRVKDAGLSAFLFGGLMRHLMTGRRSTLPRDVDVVVDCEHTEELFPLFSDYPTRVNRFGGLRILTQIPLDIWAIPDTWAFTKGLWAARPENLPHTTFFNVEAIVAAVDSSGTHRREIYSSGFFEGIVSQTLQLNSPHNPHPALCVVRAIIMAQRLDFWVGVSLVEYLARVTRNLSSEDLDQAQRSHYGCLYLSARDVRAAVASIEDQLESGCENIAVPGSGRAQRGMWREFDASDEALARP